MATAHGKIILFGEHSVVYGRRAIAASLPIPIETRISAGDGGRPRLCIPAWNIDHRLTELPAISRSLDHALLQALAGDGAVTGEDGARARHPHTPVCDHRRCRGRSRAG